MPRPKKTPDTADMLEAAQLYYEKELTKQQIAKRLKIDPREVTWLLSEARRLRLVRIDIPGLAQAELEQRLIEKFPQLERALIVTGSRDRDDNPLPPSNNNQYDALLRNCGVLAADYFSDLADRAGSKPFHVGISGGETVLEFANAVQERQRDNVYVHTTALIGTGGFRKTVTHILPIVTASVLWSKCGRVGGHCQYATVGPYDSEKPSLEARATAETRLEDIARQRSIREVIEAASNIDTAFVGIGIVSLPPEVPAALKSRLRVTIADLLPMTTQEQLDAEGAIADFSGVLLDAAGKSKEKWRFFLTAGHYSDHPGIAFFQRMVEDGRKVVAIAAAYKVPAIRAALAAEAFNVLVTSEHSAKELLEKN